MPDSAHNPPKPVESTPVRSSVRDALLIGVGWTGTVLALTMPDIPLDLLMKDVMGLAQNQVAAFKFLGAIPIYIKPLAGVLTDAVPWFGSRRRSYLLISLAAAAFFYLAMALVPREYGWMLAAFFMVNVSSTMISTVLGGLMVEVGQRDRATGRLSAQRQAITRGAEVVTGPLGGFLATMPFLYTAAAAAACEAILIPIFGRFLKEPAYPPRNSQEVLTEVRRQFRTLFSSRILWSAALLVVLVVAAPGFKTPLIYYQRDVLKLSSVEIGQLKALGAIAGFLGASFYALVCRRLSLRPLLAISILQHGLLTLLYTFYRDFNSAAIITCVEAVTMALALLPLYDLAARATPRGSEAIGYSLMMSVWNFTDKFADYLGSALIDRLNLTFQHLIYVNSGSTLLVLIAVPLLPKALMDYRDGDPALAKGESSAGTPGH